MLASFRKTLTAQSAVIRARTSAAFPTTRSNVTSRSFRPDPRPSPPGLRDPAVHLGPPLEEPPVASFGRDRGSREAAQPDVQRPADERSVPELRKGRGALEAGVLEKDDVDALRRVEKRERSAEPRRQDVPEPARDRRQLVLPLLLERGHAPPRASIAEALPLGVDEDGRARVEPARRGRRPRRPPRRGRVPGASRRRSGGAGRRCRGRGPRGARASGRSAAGAGPGFATNAAARTVSAMLAWRTKRRNGPLRASSSPSVETFIEKSRRLPKKSASAHRRWSAALSSIQRRGPPTRPPSVTIQRPAAARMPAASQPR